MAKNWWHKRPGQVRRPNRDTTVRPSILRLEDRVTWKLEAARLCMQAGRHEMALAQLEALDDELHRASIEDWDPALCAEILRDLLRCRQQVAQSADFAPSDHARSRELMGRLCRLDVVSALELNGRE